MERLKQVPYLLKKKQGPDSYNIKCKNKELT